MPVMNSHYFPYLPLDNFLLFNKFRFAKRSRFSVFQFVYVNRKNGFDAEVKDVIYNPTDRCCKLNKKLI